MFGCKDQVTKSKRGDFTLHFSATACRLLSDVSSKLNVRRSLYV
jgi:hypothetical protein